MDNNKPVDLKQAMERKSGRVVPNKQNSSQQEKKEAIKKVFEDSEKPENSFHKIDKAKKDNTNIYRNIFLLLLILAVGFFVFKFILSSDNFVKNDEIGVEWYAVTLIDNDIFYGQIDNTSADPLIIENVYYNYDKDKETSPTGNLRLVKRGKETHGPTGSMSIIRAQVKYLEPLKEDSKVLKAIVEYEK